MLTRLRINYSLKYQYLELIISRYYISLYLLLTMSVNQEITKKCNEAQKLKEEGNTHYKNKDLVKALRSYHQANLYLNGLIDKQSPMASYSAHLLSEEESKRVNCLKFAVFMNMGQIYISQSKFQKAKDILVKASEIKLSTKLKFRLAIVYMNLAELDKSKTYFSEALAEDSSLAVEINQSMVKLKQIQKKENQKSKNMYAKFFSGDSS